METITDTVGQKTSRDPLQSTALGAIARDGWINSCEFHSMSEAEVLAETIRRIETLKSAAETRARPLVLLDLDSTLYEVGHRTFQILKEWVDTEESESFSEVRERIAAIELGQVGYSLKDTFGAVGLDASDAAVIGALDSAKKFWSRRFFTNDYLTHDRPYPGAAQFVRNLHAVGAELIYLTGRDEPGMGIGTRRNLIRDGFPWETERTHLLMKPRFEMDDAAHKVGAADFVRKNGTLIASFENEPVNLVSLYELFPDAMHVFMETICSDRPAPVCSGLYRIRGFAQSE